MLKPETKIVINFPSDYFWLFQTAIGVLCSVYAFKEYVDDHIVTALVTVSLGVPMLLARAKFKTRPPEWALVDPEKNLASETTVAKVLRN